MKLAFYLLTALLLSSLAFTNASCSKGPVLPPEIKALKKVADKNPDNQPLTRTLIEALYSRRFYDEALKYSEKLLKINPGSSDGLLFAGRSSERLGRWDDAEGYYRKLIEKAPGEPSGHLSLGALLMNKGMFRESADPLKEAAAIARPGTSEHAGALIGLAESQYYGGDPEAAYRTLDSVLVSDPSSADALYNYGLWKLRESKYPDAIRLLSAAAAAGGDRGRALYRLGKAYYNSGDLDGARKVFNEAGESDAASKFLASVIFAQKYESTYERVNTAVVRAVAGSHYKDGETYRARGVVENIGLEMARDVTVVVQFLDKDRNVVSQKVFETSPRNLRPEQFVFYEVSAPCSEKITDVDIKPNWQKRAGKIELK